MNRRRTAALAAVAWLVGMIAGCSSDATGPGTTPSGPPPDRLPTTALPHLLTGVSNVTRIAQLTGPDGLNHTDTVEVAGADLGSMFQHDGKTWFVFGDTFGKREPGLTGGGGEEWRSNALAYSTDTDPSDGITFDGFITDPKTGWALEMIPGDKIDNEEMTKIPTYGFSANGAMYLAYMSVRHWGEPGEWETNYSGFAKSTDDGKTWTQLAGPKWKGDSNFVQVSVTNVDGELYFHGVTHGRFGGVQLMKVAETDVEKPAAYQYFSGTAADGTPQWSSDIGAARTIVDAAVGELSVVWNPYLNRWLMTYTAGDGGGSAIREAAAPWGPWSDAIPLVTQTDAPGLYSPYMSPAYLGDGGRRIYFTLSIWDPYQVFWYRADLDRAGVSPPPSR